MTIASRRRVYWALFLLAVVALATGIFLAIPIFSGRVDSTFLGPSRSSEAYAPFGLRIRSIGGAAVGGLLSPLFSAIVLGAVLASFRKTSSTEIFWFAVWCLSLGFEVGRILVFRLAAAGLSENWISLADRFVLATRFTGYAAMFLSGLHAAGFHTEKAGTALAVILGLGTALAASLPLDTGIYGSTLLVRPGYSVIAQLFALLLALVTMVNFLHAARVTGERTYRMIALASAALLAGQFILLLEWRLEWLLTASILLGLGSRLFISRLHAYYLWQ